MCILALGVCRRERKRQIFIYFRLLIPEIAVCILRDFDLFLASVSTRVLLCLSWVSVKHMFSISWSLLSLLGCIMYCATCIVHEDIRPLAVGHL